MVQKGPRDRAVRVRSKKALVQTRRESTKQLSFTDGPFGGTTKQIVSEIAKWFAKIFRPVGEGFYYIERFGKRKDTRESQQELLPYSMAGS